MKTPAGDDDLTSEEYIGAENINKFITVDLHIYSTLAQNHIIEAFNYWIGPRHNSVSVG